MPYDQDMSDVPCGFDPKETEYAKVCQPKSKKRSSFLHEVSLLR